MNTWARWYLRLWASALGVVLGIEGYAALTYTQTPRLFPTLSEIIVNALTPLPASVITLSLAVILCWHWYQVARETRERDKQEEIQMSNPNDFVAFRVVVQRGETHGAAFERERVRCGFSYPMTLPVLSGCGEPLTLTDAPTRDLRAGDGVWYVKFEDE